MFGQSGSYSVVSRPRNQVRYPSGLGQPLTRFPARRAKMVRMIFGSFPANFPLYLPLGLIQTTAYRGVSAAEEIVLFARGGLLRWSVLNGRAVNDVRRSCRLSFNCFLTFNYYFLLSCHLFLKF